MFDCVKRVPVFLPGWGQGKESMEGFRRYFPEVECVFLDLPGFGKIPLEKKMTTQDYVDYVHDTLKKQNVSPSVFIGHSFGGKVATYYALRYPVPLVLLAPSIVPPKKTLLYGVKKCLYPLFKEAKNLGYIEQMPFFLKGSLDYQNSSGFLRETFLSVVHDYHYQRIKEIKKEVVLIGFEKDKAVRPKRLLLAKKIAPSIERIIFPGDHFGYVQHLGEISNIIRRIGEMPL